MNPNNKNILAIGLMIVCISLTIVPSLSTNANASTSPNISNKCGLFESLEPSLMDRTVYQEIKKDYINCVQEQQKLDKLNQFEGTAISPESDDDIWGEKKYCEGKGEWNGKTCITDNEEEKAAWEDAVCDNPDSGSKICGGGGSSNNDDDDNEQEGDGDGGGDNNNDNNNNDVEQQQEQEQEESEEQQEQEKEEEEDDKDNDDGDSDSGDDGGGDDNDEGN